MAFHAYAPRRKLSVGAVGQDSDPCESWFTVGFAFQLIKAIGGMLKRNRGLLVLPRRVAILYASFAECARRILQTGVADGLGGACEYPEIFQSGKAFGFTAAHEQDALGGDPGDVRYH